ncbi:MAG: helix-turn-helix domain-containing protein [Xanthobacteraceae bacterium]
MIEDGKHRLGVYSVVSDESGRDVWVEIGSASQHQDGRGFDLTLQALPLASRLVLRELDPDGSQDEPRAESLEDSREDPHKEPTGASSLASQVRQFERATISQCLLETGGNIGAALERLKIPRRTLNEKMVRLGIDRRRLKRPRAQRTKADDGNPEPESVVVRGDLFLQQPGLGKNGATNGR